MDLHARPVLVFRWVVFLLAGALAVRQIAIVGDYTDPGGPFRFLTHWALLLSFFSASRMLAFSERRSTRRWPHLVAMTAVVNVMTVGLYWGLRADDPANLNNDPDLPMWVNLYLHLLGPMLQWLDALVVESAFRRPLRTVPWLLGLICLYVFWIEVLVAPANDTPYGAVTSGLPYPFLNNMEATDRAVFYGAVTVVALIVLGALALLARAVRGTGQTA